MKAVFYDLSVGDYFIDRDGDTFQVIPSGMGGYRYEGCNAFNVLSSKPVFAGFGPAHPVERIERPADLQRWIEQVPKLKTLPDTRTYEFGIGEINTHDDAYYSMPEQIETGELIWVYRGNMRKGPMPNGCRYDEACAVCGKVTVICNDCGCCENCCMC